MGKRKSTGVYRIPEQELEGIVRKVVQGEIYRGPLPHPDHLAKYEDLYPGSAKKLIELLDDQSHHRMDLEKAVISSNIFNERRGQIFAFIICMTAIIGGFAAIFFDKNVLGIGSVLGSLAALVTVFIIGKSKTKRELQNRAGPR